MHLRWVLLWFSFCVPLLGFGQQMQFENIGNSINLPSQECYKVKQDSEGYIWFSTEQGLCRYDGKKLLVYDEKNGLPEKAVYAIEQDKTGRMWFLTSANRIVYIENGKIKEPLFSKNFQQAANGITPASFMFVNKHEIYVSMTTRGTFLINTRTHSVTKSGMTEF